MRNRKSGRAGEARSGWILSSPTSASQGNNGDNTRPIVTNAGHRRSSRPFAATLKELFCIGCIGFGGGSALIPVFKERFGRESKEDACALDDSIAIACITPGALPVELAAGIGLRERGVLGSFAAAAAFALPGVILLVGALCLLGASSDAAMTQVSFAAAGVCAYILSVIACYIWGSVRQAATRKGTALSCTIVAGVFIVTCEKSLYTLLGMASVTPLFAIGTVNVMIVAFFAAIWIGAKRTPKRMTTASVICVLYCLLKGKLLSEVDPDGIACVLLQVAMLVMAIWAIAADKRENCSHIRFEKPSELIRTIVLLTAIALAATAIAQLFCSAALTYSANGAVSSILSFGGGDAYIAMADGLFVESGIVDQGDFYSQVVPVANALPGSILCKVLVGCGYLAGIENAGSMSAALAMCVAGFSCAVAMSCITFAVGRYFYEALEGLAAFAAIKRVIGCVVSGLLLTVALGLLQTCEGASAYTALSSSSAMALVIILAALNLYVRQRFSLPALAAVIGSATITLIVFNLAM